MTPEMLKVRDFMLSAQQACREKPTAQIGDKEIELRLDLIAEELIELASACGVRVEIQTVFKYPTVNLVEVLDALTDLRYVIYGTYLSFGLARVSTNAFNEVHASNMSKTQGGLLVRNELGKVQKPATYFPPNLGKFIHS